MIYEENEPKNLLIEKYTLETYYIFSFNDH
jgi:hypothetical protein